MPFEEKTIEEIADLIEILHRQMKDDLRTANIQLTREMGFNVPEFPNEAHSGEPRRGWSARIGHYNTFRTDLRQALELLLGEIRGDFAKYSRKLEEELKIARELGRDR